jgi:hypothetical protein
VIDGETDDLVDGEGELGTGLLGRGDRHDARDDGPGVDADANDDGLAPVGRAVGGITLGALAERMAMTFGIEDSSQFADVVESGEVEFF